MGILRWGVHFNIAFTRLISFNMDYYWMLNSSPINRRKVFIFDVCFVEVPSKGKA